MTWELASLSPEKATIRDWWVLGRDRQRFEHGAVDFTKGAGEWHLLGTYHNPRYVSVSNAAEGAIVADAVKFEGVEDEHH